MNLLQTEKLTKYFGETHAVDKVAFTIGEGEVLALIGSNGAGKTTLVNLISGLIQPDSGQILFRGADVTHQSVHGRIKAGIARSFQIVNLFDELTVLDNVALSIFSREGLTRFFWSLPDQHPSGAHGDAPREDLRFKEERSLLGQRTPRRQELDILDVMGAEPDPIRQPPAADLGGDPVKHGERQKGNGSPSHSERRHHLAQRVSRALKVLAAASIAQPASARARMLTMMTAGSDRVCSRDDHMPPPTSRLPMPFSAISISAPTAVIQAMASEYLSPPSTAGLAAGRTTLMSKSRPLAPSDRAATTYFPATSRTP